ncbi:MAG: endonuclease/exonuclease/phosphatase family protein [Bacteroidales bacterium]|nr:endonuclease/exonuclease/phosphatase family protein [Bacteroidales bacterium]
MIIDYILIILSFLIGIPNILSTGLSLLHFQYWWIRIFDYPKLQMIAFMIVAFILYCMGIVEADIFDYTYLSLLSITIIYQLYKVLPYTKFSKLQVLGANNNNAENHFSIVICNVLMTNRNSEKCLRELTRFSPDIILAVETNEWWKNELKSLEKDYPYTALLPLENTYGMLLYSKLKTENTEFKFLVEKNVPSINPLITLPAGDKVNCYFIHPKPPIPSEAKSSKARDAELIIVAKSVKNSNIPVIVAGDLNDVGWSHTSKLFQKISGLLDPRIGRGLFATFNAKKRFFRWPLDHIFLSREFRVADIKLLDYIGSDHFSVYLKLSYEPEIANEQKVLQHNQDDLKEANKKLKRL